MSTSEQLFTCCNGIISRKGNHCPLSLSSRATNPITPHVNQTSLSLFDKIIFLFSFQKRWGPSITKTWYKMLNTSASSDYFSQPVASDSCHILILHILSMFYHLIRTVILNNNYPHTSAHGAPVRKVMFWRIHNFSVGATWRSKYQSIGTNL